MPKQMNFVQESEFLVLTGVVQCVRHCLAKHKVAGLIPGQDTCLGCGPGSQLGVCKRQPIVSPAH